MSQGEVEPPADPEAVAHAIALRLLEARPRSRQELAEALRRRRVPETAVAAVLDRLAAVGLVDDDSFAAAWVDSRHAGRRLGRRALRAELARKGIAGETAEQALSTVSVEDERATAVALVERRLRSLAGVDDAAKIRRLSGLLARKGIPTGVARQVVLAAVGRDDAAID